MPIPKEYIDIVQMVTQETLRGTLSWKEIRPGDYVVAFDAFAFNIWEWEDPNSRDSGLSVGLSDVKGDVIDNFALTKGDGGYEVLESLYQSARRKARRIDEALDKIRAALKKASGKQGKE